MSVCLSICWNISKTTRPNFTKFSVHVTCSVTRSSSDGSEICYTLPVLRMTPCFPIIEPMGKIRNDAYVSSSSPDGTSRTSDDVMFGQDHQLTAAPEATSAVSGCILFGKRTFYLVILPIFSPTIYGRPCNFP